MPVGKRYIGDLMALSVIMEATNGTFLAPTTVLPISRGGGVPEPKFDTDVYDPMGKAHGIKETTVLTDFATVEYSAKMKLPTAHGLIAPAFAMCGVVASDIDGGKAYKYSTGAEGTASLRWTEQRSTTEAKGARADFTITAEVKKAVEIEFAIKSDLHQVVELGSEADDNVIPDTPDVSSVFMKKDCTAYLVNGNAAHFQKVTLKLKAETSLAEDSCPFGASTTDVAPELTISMALTEENEASFEDLKNGTEFNFVIPFFDVNGVKKWELIVPRCVATAQKKSEKNRKLNVEKTLECRPVTTDDAWELKAFD